MSEQAENESDNSHSNYPLHDHLSELKTDAVRKTSEHDFIVKTDIPCSRSREELDQWTKQANRTGVEALAAKEKLDRFQQDNRTGLERETRAMREEKPLDESERKANESAVRGFEDLENGRNTPEGYDAGIRRFDARIDRDKETISEQQHLAKLDRSVGDEYSYNFALDRQTDAANDIQQAEDEKYAFQNNYWAKGADAGNEAETTEQTEDETEATEQTENETEATEQTEDEAEATEQTEDEAEATEQTEDEAEATEQTKAKAETTEQAGDQSTNDYWSDSDNDNSAESSNGEGVEAFRDASADTSVSTGGDASTEHFVEVDNSL